MDVIGVIVSSKFVYDTVVEVNAKELHSITSFPRSEVLSKANILDFDDCTVYEIGGEDLDKRINETSFMVVQRA